MQFFKLFNLDDAGITIDSKDIMINEFFNNVNNFYDSIEFALNLYDYDIIKNLLNFFYENDEIKKFILDIFNKSANLSEEEIKKLIYNIFHILLFIDPKIIDVTYFDYDNELILTEVRIFNEIKKQTLKISDQDEDKKNFYDIVTY